MGTIKLLTSWDEVNLATYLKVAEIQASEDLRNHTIMQSVEMIAALSDKTSEEVLEFDQSMFATCLEKISFIYNDEVEDKSSKPFQINGVNYMVHPNFDQLTTGEMVSIEQAILNASETGGNYLDELLAILVRPCTEINGVWTIDKFRALEVETRRELYHKYLYVPFFLHRLLDFYDGSVLSVRTLAQSSGKINEVKNRLKKLIS